jgi:hypothetical protein
MQSVSTDIHATFLSALGESYAEQVRRVEVELETACDNGTLQTAAESFDGLWRLRLEIQSRLLAATGQSNQGRLRSIIQDMDQQFGTQYFALDRELLPMIFS